MINLRFDIDVFSWLRVHNKSRLDLGKIDPWVVVETDFGKQSWWTRCFVIPRRKS